MGDKFNIGLRKYILSRIPSASRSVRLDKLIVEAKANDKKIEAKNAIEQTKVEAPKVTPEQVESIKENLKNNIKKLSGKKFDDLQLESMVGNFIKAEADSGQNAEMISENVKAILEKIKRAEKMMEEVKSIDLKNIDGGGGPGIHDGRGGLGDWFSSLFQSKTPEAVSNILSIPIRPKVELPKETASVLNNPTVQTPAPKLGSIPLAAPVAIPKVATSTPIKKPGYDIPEDYKNKVLATMMAEAENQDEIGLQAVLNTMHNRIGTKNLTGGIRENIFDVISEPAQYSAFSVSNPKYAKYRDYLRGKKVNLLPIQKQLLDKIKEFYEQASTGELKDLTNGATFYYNPSVVEPYWGKLLRDVITIGNHKFGKL